MPQTARSPLANARVLDLFAGSGALGIEALSRGAASAVFVERHRVALAALSRNLAQLALSPPTAEVRAHDALAVLARAASARERFDLVFLDPPYAEAERLARPLGEAVPAVLATRGIVVVEAAARAPLALPLPVLRQRRYRDTIVTIHCALTARRRASG